MSNETKAIFAEATRTGLNVMAKAMPVLLGWVAWLAFSYGSMSTNVSKSNEDYSRRIALLEQKDEVKTELISRLTTSIETVKNDVGWIRNNMEKNK